jgi:hypothetical protein
MLATDPGDGIDAGAEDGWNRRRRHLGRQCGRSVATITAIRRRTKSELDGNGLIAVGKPVLDRDVLADREAFTLQALAKGRQQQSFRIRTTAK